MAERKEVDIVKKDILKKAISDTIPVMTGYIALGIGFGVLMQTNGYEWYWASIMAIFIFAGSMQYVAIGLLTGGAGLLTTALTTFMVNARHLFYGLSLVEKYKNVGKIKPYLIFGLTDETYSLVCSKDEGKQYYFLVTLLDHLYWITGCTLGAVLGNFIKFNTEGIDFALTALFVSIDTEQWLGTKNHIPAIVGAFASIVCILAFGSDNFLIPTMFVITALLLISGKKVKQ